MNEFTNRRCSFSIMWKGGLGGFADQARYASRGCRVWGRRFGDTSHVIPVENIPRGLVAQMTKSAMPNIRRRWSDREQVKSNGRGGGFYELKVEKREAAGNVSIEGETR